MLGIALGVVVANGLEWIIHKHVLHGWGRERTSYWSFHWHEHHRAARTLDHRDPAYEGWTLKGGPWHGDAQSKEAWGLLGIGVLTLPLAPIAPWFVGTLWAHGLIYHRVHRQAHLDTEFARRWLPWHYDHHMGPDQNANWCVTWPLFDWIMGTRKPYCGTDRELEERARRLERLASA